MQIEEMASELLPRLLQVPVPTGALRPGALDDSKFIQDWSVQFWRDFRIPEDIKNNDLALATRYKDATVDNKGCRFVGANFCNLLSFANLSVLGIQNRESTGPESRGPAHMSAPGLTLRLMGSRGTQHG